MKLMELRHFLLVSLLVANVVCEDYSITPINTSSGLYYENIGDVLLSNSNWQFVTSVDYEGYLLFYQYLFQQADEFKFLCQQLSSSVCNERYNTIKASMNRIADIDTTLANFLGIEEVKNRRVKRAWLELAALALPYILEPAGKAIGSRIEGGMSQKKLQEYDQYLTELRNSQKELDNKISMQITTFMIDSERKNFQINWLERSQHKLEENIKILNSTFTEDSKLKEMKIQSLKEMLDETKNKLKMQKDIQNNLVRDVNDIKQKLKNVDEDIKYIKANISANTNDIDKLKLVTNINTLSQNFNFLLSRFETEQKTLFDVIEEANSGHLKPYIITPLNLIEMMEKAQSMLPEGTKFPFYPNFTNAHHLYNLIVPSVQFYNNKIMFILTIPIAIAKTFVLNKMTSLPVPVQENYFVFILPKDPYLLVDKSDSEYTIVSYNSFQEFCKKIDKMLYLCEQISQTSITNLNSDCEMNLYLNPTTIPNSCNKRIMYLEKPIFLQLLEPMSWIYTVPTKESLSISCGGHRVAVDLHGSGIVKLKSSCTGRTSRNSLFTVNKFTSRIHSSFTPRVDILDSVDLSHVENVKRNSNTNTKDVVPPFDYKELESMSVDSQKLAGSYKYTTIIGIAIVIASVVLLLVFLFRRRLFKSIL